jgi:predicted GH43/DUF377 family glycosyl hydrolase
MNVIEFEEYIWTERMERYRFRTVDIINEGFRPLGGMVGDFCTIEHDGRYHFFYTERHLTTEGLPGYPGNECYIGHASTANFFEWEVHYPILWVQPGTWEHLVTGAPNIVYYKGRFVMAYFGVNEYLVQDMGFAFSDDLFAWERWEKNPLSPCKGTSWAFWRDDGPTSCRDAHLFVHDGRLWMTYTANTKEGASCIALISTDDFVHWEDHGPILSGPAEGFQYKSEGQRPQGHLESSNLIQKGDKWFLLVQETHLNTDVRNWIYESDCMNQFSYASGRKFWQGALTTEVVKEKDQLSLLACMGVMQSHYMPNSCQRDQHSLLASMGSIKFGLVDWSVEKPAARFITSKKGLLKWSCG